MKQAFEFDAPDERVWESIADPAKRAGTISVIDRFNVSDDDRHAMWYLELSTPLVRLTVTAEMEDIEVDEPTHVKFAGKPRAMRVTGEHTIGEHDGDSHLINKFTVDGRLPGVETFFEHGLDRELNNLETELRRELEATA